MKIFVLTMLSSMVTILRNHFVLCGRSASSRRLSELVDAIAYRMDDSAVDHPMIFPLATVLMHELDVVRAACKVRDAQSTRPAQDAGLLLSLLELRSAITVWEEGHEGQVRFTRGA